MQMQCCVPCCVDMFDLPCLCDDIAMLWSCVELSLQCGCHAIVVILPCSCHAIAIILLWHGVAMFYTLLVRLACAPGCHWHALAWR
jgi:hypothetical protein